MSRCRRERYSLCGGAVNSENGANGWIAGTKGIFDGMNRRIQRHEKPIQKHETLRLASLGSGQGHAYKRKARGGQSPLRALRASCLRLLRVLVLALPIEAEHQLPQSTT